MASGRLQSDSAPSRACRHLHMLLDTELDAPGPPQDEDGDADCGRR